MKTVAARIVVPALALAAAGLMAPPAPAESGRSTGRPVPRFVSLEADTANLRAGPGKRYPVDWVYKRPRLPLKVVAEHGAWRRVQAWDGTTGWMHSALLTGRRTVQVTGERERLLRAGPNPEADVVARLQPKVIGALDACQKVWCAATFADLSGWVRRRYLFGVHRTAGGGAADG